MVRSRVRRAFGGAAILTLSCASHAWTQSKPFEIPSEDAGQSIPELARQAGVQIIAPGKELHGLTTPAVKGIFDVRAALTEMLKGTRISIASDDGQTIVLAIEQTSEPPATTNIPPLPGNKEVVVVTGSQIIGSEISGTVPLTIVDASQIMASAAVSGNGLIRSIPQMGSTNFNSSFLPGSSNSARGDVASIDLRGLGEGNTLLLVNGRRVAVDPENQAGAYSAVPVVSYNANAIPISDAQRLEILLDGASALYGSDAVAGVVNVITNQNMHGGRISIERGDADGTHYGASVLDALFGVDFLGDRANVTVSLNYTQESALRSSDQYFTSTANKTGLFADTAYAGLSSLNLDSATSPWGTFAVIPGTVVTSGVTALTNTSGTFHIQPATDTGCALGIVNGACIGAGAQAISSTGLNTRSDSNADYPLSITPSVNRYNFFGNAHYDVTSSFAIYSEAGWYQADTQSIQLPVAASGSTTVTVPASNYWNPFGPIVFADGTVNPNRLPNLNIPAAGIPVAITTYQFADTGPYTVRDHAHQGRILLGAKGEIRGFHWDTAVLYSDAANRDVGEGLNSQLLQANLALSTPNAYNPFNGGNPANPGGRDSSPSSPAALGAAKSFYTTDTYSTLGLWDFKISKNDLFYLPAGAVGMATGVEVRHEFMSDNRDPTIDGTVQFTDTVTGVTTVSDQLGVSQTPDARGERWVESAYAEFALPLVSRAMNIPLVEKVNVQIAGRYENFSDVGGVGKPKIAFSWDIIDSLRLRGSWAQGFQAPNLIQEHETLLTRANTNTDYVRCAADLNAGRIGDFANCSEPVPATSERFGNPNLKPQTSDSKSIGVVFQPGFLSPEFGNFTFTADYWEIREKGIVGVFGSQNALILDYADRLQGKTNPNVVRAAPTASDIAQFVGTGIAPAGQLLYVTDQYINQNPQDARGLDLEMHWSLRDTNWGSFSVDVDVARMIGLFLQPSSDVQALLNDRASGLINAGTNITGAANLLQQNANPKMKWIIAPSWTDGPWTVGCLVSYVGTVYDTGLINASAQPFIVPAQLTGNLYTEFKFNDGMFGKDMRVRIGARNISNAPPPPFLNAYGFIGGLYEPLGRFVYVNLTKTF